jgi:hypothetical protein
MGLTRTSEAPVEERTVQDLVALIGKQQTALQRTLSRHHIGKPRRETARSVVLAAVLYRLDTLSRLLRWNVESIDPCLKHDLELLLGRVGELVSDAEEALSRPSGFDPFGRQARKRNPFLKLSYREAAWELVLELDCALLEVGDTQYLSDRLDQERQLDNRPETENRWSDLYDPEQLRELSEALRTEPPTPGVRNRVVEMLARLLQKRSDTDRGYRAQETLRSCDSSGPTGSCSAPWPWGWRSIAPCCSTTGEIDW